MGIRIGLVQDPNFSNFKKVEVQGEQMIFLKSHS